MVIREENDHWLLITQPAHAWISGQIAENWGAGDFITPEPWKELCFAATNHDAGWIKRDSHPVMNPDTGLPYDFMTIPVNDHLAIWNESVAQILNYSRFAALLVSRHVIGLCTMHDFTNDPQQVRNRAAQFKEGQHILQAQLLKELETDSFYKQFTGIKNLEKLSQLLSAFDYLSLALITDFARNPVINTVPSKNSLLSVRVASVRKNPNIYSLSSWPFKTNRVLLRCDAIRLGGRCSDQQELDKALEQGDRVLFEVQLDKKS